MGFNLYKNAGYSPFLVFSDICLNKQGKMENKETWKNISIREKMQLINGTMLIISAIILYFVAFILTMTIGMEIVSAGATLLATGLAFFGITGYIKNQMIHFEGRVERQIKEYEERRRHDTEPRRYTDNDEGDISDNI